MDIGPALRRHGDLLLAVVLAAVFAGEVLAWDAADLPKALPSAVIGGLALALRRKTPLVAFLVAWAGSWGVLTFAPGIDNDSVAFIIIFFVSLYSLGRYTTGYEVWLGGLCVLGYIMLFLLGDPSSDLSDLGDIGFATLFVGTPWAAGLALRLRQEREHALSIQNRELEQTRETMAREAVAAERARIARELHDVVSHAISVTVLQARGGRRMLGVDEEEVRRALDAIEHTNTQALGDMRRLLSLLRDTEEQPAEEEPQTDPQPSLARLESLVDRLRGSGLPVELEITGRSDDVPPGVDLSAYRIIQEALTNVTKHGGPTARARVTVAYGVEDLVLSVSDSGAGPESAAATANGTGPSAAAQNSAGPNGTASTGVDGRGHGLLGIRERVAVVGGHVEAGPGPDGGFEVHARLPYTVEA